MRDPSSPSYGGYSYPSYKTSLRRPRRPSSRRRRRSRSRTCRPRCCRPGATRSWQAESRRGSSTLPSSSYCSSAPIANSRPGDATTSRLRYRSHSRAARALTQKASRQSPYRRSRSAHFQRISSRESSTRQGRWLPRSSLRSGKRARRRKRLRRKSRGKWGLLIRATSPSWKRRTIRPRRLLPTRRSRTEWHQILQRRSPRNRTAIDRLHRFISSCISRRCEVGPRPFAQGRRRLAGRSRSRDARSHQSSGQAQRGASSGAARLARGSGITNEEIAHVCLGRAQRYSARVQKCLGKERVRVGRLPCGLKTDISGTVTPELMRSLRRSTAAERSSRGRPARQGGDVRTGRASRSAKAEPDHDGPIKRAQRRAGNGLRKAAVAKNS